MELLGSALSFIGLVIAFIGGIWFLIVAFNESILWGIGCLLVPFVSIVFLIMNFDESKKPFFINLGGIILVVIGMFLSGEGLSSMPME